MALRSIPMTRRVFASAVTAAVLEGAEKRRTENVIHVMTDGLRWQEVFSGADDALMNRANGGVGDEAGFRKQWWRATAEERRELLMPFLWGTVAKQGQLFGNRKAGSEVAVTNGKNFSYPGYSETFCGYADDRIDSNDKKYNPNVSVYEWLHQKAAFRGKVAAFGAWDVFPWILNAPRAGFPVNAGHEAWTGAPVTEKMKLLNRLKGEMKIWEGEALDALTHETALEYLKQRKPRVLFISYGDTDEWAHDGKYGLYLQAANRVDRYWKELWETVQGMAQYRGKTTLVMSVDHGRGEAPLGWKSHGERIPDSKYMWMGFLGPDTKALGERKQVRPLYQNQIAATVAALLGEDYKAAVPKAGGVIGDVTWTS